MKRKLLLAALCVVGAIGGGNSLMAQTDVTSQYLTNADFDTNPNVTSSGVSTEATTFYANGTTIVYNVDGWTAAASVPNNAAFGGTFTYGSSGTNNGVSNIGVDKFGKNSGAALGLSSGWGNYPKYTQEVTLPAGNYKLTLDAINRADTKTINKNYFGWEPEGGDAVYSTQTSFEQNVWYTISVEFTLENTTKGKISVGLVGGTAGSASTGKLFVDNVKIFKMDADPVATIANPIDYSDLINQTKWSVKQDDNTTPTTSSALVTNITSGDWTGRYVERYRGAAGHYGKALYQTISVPAGVYQVQAACMSSSANNVDAAAGKKDGDLNVAYFYANSEELTYALSDKKGYFRKHIVTLDSDGTIEFGINTKVVGANWNAIGCATLVKVANNYDDYIADLLSVQIDQLESLQSTATNLLADGTYINVVGDERTELTAQSIAIPTENTVAAYETTIDAVQAAIEAFTAAKSNYDALVAEIVKAKALGIATETADSYAATASSTAATALTSTQNLKVAEYNYVTTTYQYGVTLGEWTSEATNTAAADFDNEHWSGESKKYKNQKDDWGNPKQGYAAENWSIKFNQDVALPAGNYVFKVAGRQASGDKVVTSLVVKNGEDVLGSVSDFPRSNSSRGINKSGATAFEGDNANFANDGKGYGWEWRYVKFSLAKDATVNIAIESVATAASQWVSFGDYTVQTDNEANISLIAYNVALASAQTVIADAVYTNVTGSEKTTLQAAIAADGTLDKTSKDAIDAATATLNNAKTTFTGAKAAYDAYVAAKAKEYEDNLPYASATKFAVITTAQGAADATSATDATNKTNAILSAYRKYVESNALAERVYGAVNKTDLIKDPNFANVTIEGTKAGGWTFDQTGGNANINSNESFTDGDNSSNYNYFDYYNGSNNNQHVHQVIENLAPGRYILSATGRGHANFNGNLKLYAGNKSVNIPAIGNTGGTFDRGWNDVTLAFDQTETSNVTIGAKTDNGKKEWWGVTRFRLVKIADIKKSSAHLEGYKTFYNADLNYEADGSTEVYIAAAPEKGYVSLTKMEADRVVIPAGTPVILKTSNTTDYKITLTPTTASSSNDFSANVLKVAETAGAIDGAYILAYTTADGLGFYNYTGSLDAGDVYLTAAAGSGSNVRLSIVADGETTGIAGVDAEAGKDTEAIYNMAGQRVDGSYKGIVIKNGKKYMIK